MFGLVFTDSDDCGDLHNLVKIYYLLSFIIFGVFLIVLCGLGIAYMTRKNEVKLITNAVIDNL